MRIKINELATAFIGMFFQCNLDRAVLVLLCAFFPAKNELTFSFQRKNQQNYDLRYIAHNWRAWFANDWKASENRIWMKATLFKSHTVTPTYQANNTTYKSQHLRVFLKRAFQLTVDVPYEYCSVIWTSRDSTYVSTKRYTWPVAANFEIVIAARSTKKIAHLRCDFGFGGFHKKNSYLNDLIIWFMRRSNNLIVSSRTQLSKYWQSFDRSNDVILPCSTISLAEQSVRVSQKRIFLS